MAVVAASPSSFQVDSPLEEPSDRAVTRAAEEERVAGAATRPDDAARRHADLVQLLEDLLADRPRPLRTYDQIHMHTPDLAAHIELVAPVLEGRDVLVMGDSD